MEESFFLINYLFIYLLWPCHVACGILVPQPGIEPMPPALEACCLNHRTSREAPRHGGILNAYYSRREANLKGLHVT